MYIVAAAIVLGGDGTVLLGRRSADRAFYPDCWDLFGGHTEPGETLDQTLCRELQEEIGITPTRFQPFATFLEPDPDRNGPGRVHGYLVTAWEGTPENRQTHEHDEIRWFAFDEAARLDLAHPDCAFILRQFL